MPPIEANNAKASTLADVLRNVRDAFDAFGDATIVQVGAEYRGHFGAGSGPAVLFVPEVRGSVDDPIEAGNAASMRHGCDLFIRADIEIADDFARFDAACDLADLVLDCIHTAAPGRITWGACDDDSPVKTDTGMGVGLALHFEHRRDVRHNARRWVADVRTSAGYHANPMTPTPNTDPPFLQSAPGATYADAADLPVTVSPVDPPT